MGLAIPVVSASSPDVTSDDQTGSIAPDIRFTSITYNTVTTQLWLYTDYDGVLKHPYPWKLVTVTDGTHSVEAVAISPHCMGSSGVCKGNYALVTLDTAGGVFADTTRLSVNVPEGILEAQPAGNVTKVTASLTKGSVDVLNPVFVEATYRTGNGTLSVQFNDAIQNVDGSLIRISDGSTYIPLDGATASGSTVTFVMPVLIWDAQTDVSLTLDMYKGAVTNTGGYDIAEVNGKKVAIQRDVVQPTPEDETPVKEDDTLQIQNNTQQTQGDTHQTRNDVQPPPENKAPTKKDSTNTLTVLDATYHTNTGALSIQFSETIHSVNGSLIKVYDANHTTTLSGGTISDNEVTWTLDDHSRSEFYDTTFLKIMIEAGAVSDINRNENKKISGVYANILHVQTVIEFSPVPPPQQPIPQPEYTSLLQPQLLISPDLNIFVTTWTTTGLNERIAIPVGGSTGTYTVDWGDGNTGSFSGDAAHVYATPGSYNVSISGDFTRIRLGPVDNENPKKLTAIQQWGGIQWTSMEGAFAEAKNMRYLATDTPNLASVTNMDYMFNWASKFNGNLSGWDVSSATSMSHTFDSALSFNGDISKWNVSSVERMDGMFELTKKFNGDISKWNVSSVKRMDDMFNYAFDFDRDISMWDVSSVKRMDGMFEGTSQFKQGLSAWNTSSVEQMQHMFDTAVRFNGDVSGWDTSSVINMSRMFAATPRFNNDISGWDVSSVTDMSRMFYNTDHFNIDISGWDVSSVTDMSHMFSKTDRFNIDISGWNVSSVTDMSDMFHNAAAFRQNLGPWYITLDATSVKDGTDTVGTISAQNPYLREQNVAYSLANGADNAHFSITDDTLSINSDAPHKDNYRITIVASGSGLFGHYNSVSFTIGNERDAPDTDTETDDTDKDREIVDPKISDNPGGSPGGGSPGGGGGGAIVFFIPPPPPAPEMPLSILTETPDTVSPRIIDLSYDTGASKLYVTFDETMNTTWVDESGFTLWAGHSHSIPLDEFAWEGTHRLTADAHGNWSGYTLLNMAYGSVQDVNGNPIQRHTALPVNLVNSLAPQVVSVSYDKDTGIMTVLFDRAVYSTDPAKFVINGSSLTMGDLAGYEPLLGSGTGDSFVGDADDLAAHKSTVKMLFALSPPHADAVMAMQFLDIRAGAVTGADNVPNADILRIPVLISDTPAAAPIPAYNAISGTLLLDMEGDVILQNASRMTIRDAVASHTVSDIRALLNGWPIASGNSSLSGDDEIFLDIGHGAIVADGKIVPETLNMPVAIFDKPDADIVGACHPDISQMVCVAILERMGGVYGAAAVLGNNALLANSNLAVLAVSDTIMISSLTRDNTVPPHAARAIDNDTQSELADLAKHVSNTTANSDVLDMASIPDAPYVAVLTGSSLSFLDIANHTSPEWAGSLNTPVTTYGSLEYVTIGGLPYVVVFTQNMITTVSVADVAKPRVVHQALLDENAPSHLDAVSTGTTVYATLLSGDICKMNMTSTAQYDAECGGLDAHAGPLEIVTVNDVSYVVSATATPGVSILTTDLEELYSADLDATPTNIGAATIYGTTYVMVTAGDLYIYDITAGLTLTAVINLNDTS